MSAQQQVAGRIYRPVGPKQIAIGQLWSKGGQFSLAQGVDLSLPIMGIRIVFKGRIDVNTADYTSVNPEGVLNLITRILITGTNARQGGNVTLVDLDLPTAWMMNSMFNPLGNLFIMQSVQRPNPTTPLIGSATATLENSYFLGTAAGGNFDFIVVCDIPFHPHHCGVIFRPGFGVRQEEWKNSIQIQLTYGNQADAADGALGVSAATTTTDFTGYGVDTGSPTVDVYSLPYEMGLDLAPTVLPGVLSRISSPISTVLTQAGSNVQLGILQPKPTTRIIFKVGTSTTSPYFATLSDTNATALGITVGGNRVVRELDDIWAHANDQVAYYGRPHIQGYNLLDFIQSGSPFSAYPGDLVGPGVLFTLNANVAGVANSRGLIVQEQMLYAPGGSFYGA